MGYRRNEKEQRQYLFEKAVNSIVAQGKPAINLDGACLYRAPDGSKCAIGHLMADKDYKNHMESKPAYKIFKGNYRVKFGLKPGVKNEEFLTALQTVHDNNRFYEGEQFIQEFKNEARIFAEQWGLTLPNS